MSSYRMQLFYYNHWIYNMCESSNFHHILQRDVLYRLKQSSYMPLEFIKDNGKYAWGIWKITEDEASLQSLVSKDETIPPNVTHPAKRVEFLAARVLSHELLARWSLNYAGITKDRFGKPYLDSLSIQISLSHSYP